MTNTRTRKSPEEMTPLERFTETAQIIGGSYYTRERERTLVVTPGWLSRAAELMEMSKSHLSTIISGQRALDEQLEDRMQETVKVWLRDQQIRMKHVVVNVDTTIALRRMRAESEAAAEAKLSTMIAEALDEKSIPDLKF